MKDDPARRDLRERTFAFSVRVVRLCQAMDRSPGVSRILAKQLLRSATSIGANLEEAQASRSRADFVATCSIACREARETLYWLRLIVAVEIVPERRLAPLLKESDELVAILTSIVTKARRTMQRANTSPE